MNLSIKNSLLSKQLLLLCFFEVWERFSYYGMRALLVLYLISSLGFKDTTAYAIYTLFAAIGYIVPVLAGIIADRYTGFQRVLISGACAMCAGHFLLTFSHESLILLYLGLAAIAVGTGFFKGNITNLLGTLYSAKDANRDKGFSLFYVSINLGAAISVIACGYVAHHFGWHYGFGLAGIGMLTGLLVFLKYRYLIGSHGMLPSRYTTNGGDKEDSKAKHQKNVPVTSIIGSVLSIIILWIAAFLTIRYSEVVSTYLWWIGVLVLAFFIKVIINCSAEERTSIAILAALTFFFMCFFAIEMHLGSFVNLFTERNVNKELFGYYIPASALQSINPISIIIFGTILANTFKKLGFKHSMHRFSFGLLTNACSFLIIYLGILRTQNYQMNIGYLVLGMGLIGFCEVCIAPLIQSLYTAISPAKIKGFMIGILTFSLSYSNLLGALVGKIMSVPEEHTENAAISMEIYKNGFFNIMIASFLLLLVFIILSGFFQKKLNTLQQSFPNNS